MAVTVDFPTPPLAEETAIILLTPGIGDPFIGLITVLSNTKFICSFNSEENWSSNCLENKSSILFADLMNFYSKTHRKVFEIKYHYTYYNWKKQIISILFLIIRIKAKYSAKHTIKTRKNGRER